MSVRGWMIVLGVVLGAGLTTYALWPTTPPPEAVRKMVQDYLETPAESRSPGLEHRVMRLRGHAALGAIGLLADARLRGPAHTFLKQCAQSGEFEPPAEIEEIAARAKSEKRTLVLMAGDRVATPYTDQEWTTIRSAWERWGQDNKLALEEMTSPCDPRYEL